MDSLAFWQKFNHANLGIEPTPCQKKKAMFGPREARKPRHKTKRQLTNFVDQKKAERKKNHCPGCNEVIFNLVIKTRNYNMRAVPEVRKSFLAAYKGMRRWHFPSDIIAKLMFMIFSADVIERELGKPIVKLKCGCIYHLPCYERRRELCDSCGKHHNTTCDRHNKTLKIQIAP
jgi:hypothetical protein